jgi:acyl-ACP thioesterase
MKADELERIHFNVKRDWKMIVLLIISAVCWVVGSYEVFVIDKMGPYLTTALLLQIIYLSKMFWYKNYVVWNKKGGVIRIKSFFGESLKSNEIRSTELIDGVLTINKHGGERIAIDLNHIQGEDIR